MFHFWKMIFPYLCCFLLLFQFDNICWTKWCNLQKKNWKSINKWESYNYLNFDTKLPYCTKLTIKGRILYNHSWGCCGLVFRSTAMLRPSLGSSWYLLKYCPKYVPFLSSLYNKAIFCQNSNSCNFPIYWWISNFLLLIASLGPANVIKLKFSIFGRRHPFFQFFVDFLNQIIWIWPNDAISRKKWKSMNKWESYNYLNFDKKLPYCTKLKKRDYFGQSFMRLLWPCF